MLKIDEFFKQDINNVFDERSLIMNKNIIPLLKVKYISITNKTLCRAVIIEDNESFNVVFNMNSKRLYNCTCQDENCAHELFAFQYFKYKIFDINPEIVPSFEEVYMDLTLKLGNRFVLSSLTADKVANVLENYFLQLKQFIDSENYSYFYAMVINLTLVMKELFNNTRILYNLENIIEKINNYIINNILINADDLINIYKAYSIKLSNSFSFIEILKYFFSCYLKKKELSLDISNYQDIIKVINYLNVKSNYYALSISSSENMLDSFKKYCSYIDNDQHTFDLEDLEYCDEYTVFYIMYNANLKNDYSLVYEYLKKRENRYPYDAYIFTTILKTYCLYKEFANAKLVFYKLVFIYNLTVDDVLYLLEQYPSLINEEFLIDFGGQLFNNVNGMNILFKLTKYKELDLFRQAAKDFSNFNRNFLENIKHDQGQLAIIYCSKIRSLYLNKYYLSSDDVKKIYNYIDYLIKTNNGIYYAIEVVNDMENNIYGKGFSEIKDHLKNLLGEYINA